MNKTQQKRFDSLYQQHLTALKRQGKRDATINAYSRALAVSVPILIGVRIGSRSIT